MTTSDRPEVNRTDERADSRQLGVYQVAGHIRRMLNERANAVAYDDVDRVERLDCDLREAGYTGDVTITDIDDHGAPIGRGSGKPNVTSPVITDTDRTTTKKT